MTGTSHPPHAALVPQLAEIAQSLQAVLAMMPPEPRLAPIERAVDAVNTSHSADPRDVRLYQRARRLRDLYLPPALFADGCWDILIDLYAAQQERSLVSVSSACIAAAVPATTALRGIGMMEQGGLIHRNPDPFDRRRFHLELSDTGWHAMNDYFAAVANMVAADGARR